MSFQPKHLGKTTEYPTVFDASLLEAIPRAPGRQLLGVAADALPFIGSDLWQAYEMSWLQSNGQGATGVLELRVPAQSQSIVESKSLKLYLQSYHMTRFADSAAVELQIKQDLQQLLGCALVVSLTDLAHKSQADAALWSIKPWSEQDAGDVEVIQLDVLEFDCEIYQLTPSLLELQTSGHDAEQQRSRIYISNCFRSLCPVTGQPDFASILIATAGAVFKPESLGRYLNSFRLHQGFHEQCIEEIFLACAAIAPWTQLSVIGRFTRRGGIDINPERHLNQASAMLTASWQQRQVRQ